MEKELLSLLKTFESETVEAAEKATEEGSRVIADLSIPAFIKWLEGREEKA